MNNFKTIYKILKILEKAMDSENFDKNEISHEALGITETRWSRIMEMLAQEDYVQGVSIVNIPMTTSPGIKLVNVRITLKGLEYLEENSLMKKASNIVKGISEMIP